ncbi:MAG: TRAP transporter substrate-binding protein DctP [Deltaproteobacteria bacterium]|nr:TRAP transporter substrate-binding protein DctP [Deltaproteobacteria bacterium]
MKSGKCLKWSLVLFACLGVTLFTLNPSTVRAASKPIKWVLSTPFGSESYGGKGTAWIIERIKKNSNGQLQIEPYYASSLGYKSPEYLKVFRDGLMDMAELSPPHAMGTEPLFGACILPFTFFSYDDYYDFAQKVLMPNLSEVVEKKWNIKLIGNLMYAQTAFYGQKAITKPEDFKGLKVRVMSPLGRDIYAKLGAQPIYIPFEELYTALQRGVVQAMPNSLTAAADVKVWEVCSNASLIGYVIGTGFMVVNKKSFDALPKNLQDVVLEAGSAYSRHMKEEIKKMGNAALMQYLEHGMTLTKMPPPVLKELRAAAADVWLSWTKKVGPRAEKILKEGGLLIR